MLLLFIAIAETNILLLKLLLLKLILAKSTHSRRAWSKHTKLHPFAFLLVYIFEILSAGGKYSNVPIISDKNNDDSSSNNNNSNYISIVADVSDNH